MKDAEDRSLGRLFAMIDLAGLTSTLESRELGKTARVFIIDDQNILLNPPDGLDAGARFSVDGEVGRSADPFVLGVMHYENVEGIRVVGTQVAFPRFDWTLVAKNAELSNMNLVLEQLSITDGLTKLHNHRYFQEAFARECKRCARSKQPLSLILIDIDFFKKWNDRFGHAGGDEILRRLAEVLNQSVRETDILTRYGGEEFALIALNTDLEGATAVGEKVRQAVEAENFLTDVPSEKEQLTVSIGVAGYRDDRMDLFAKADAALYEAKDSGRNRVIAASDSD